MFQTFITKAAPEHGPKRLAALRREMAKGGLAGFLVPRTNAHQGEDVAPCDERLAWLTGFTGSAGFCVVLDGIAGVFIDGRYRLQVRHQVDTSVYTPVHYPETGMAEWLLQQGVGGKIGFDPWLHTA
ncbi:MAG TPA: aminopeptidase P family N-terminal domain-containing protein, partial [Paracoccaceae bacterium]|nr:aminopeptidase P family N-terminal domain-containing protein [Paracoccaceae bacterium]